MLQKMYSGQVFAPIDEWPELISEMGGDDWFFFGLILFFITVVVIVCISNLLGACRKNNGENRRSKKILGAIGVGGFWIIIIVLFLKGCG